MEYSSNSTRTARSTGRPPLHKEQSYQSLSNLKETVEQHKTHTEQELQVLRSLLVQHINNGPPGTVPPPPPGSAAVDTLHSEIESVNATVMKELRSVQNQINEKLDIINNNGVYINKGRLDQPQ